MHRGTITFSERERQLEEGPYYSGARVVRTVWPPSAPRNARAVSWYYKRTARGTVRVVDSWRLP